MESKYRKIEVLGSGAFGTVYKVQRNSDKLYYAMKQFNDPDIKQIIQEIKALQEMDFKNIIRYYDSSLDPPCIVMEYCEKGSLDKRIKDAKQKNKKISEEKALNIVKQILKGLRECHRSKLVHRDLKPANILINSKDVVKIGDFGLAKFMQQTHLISQCGTILYMSPEIIEGNHYDGKSDIWAVGCILYELIELQQPFAFSKSLMEIYKNIIAANYQSPKKCSSKTGKLISSMIEPDKNERIDAKEAIRMIRRILKHQDLTEDLSDQEFNSPKPRQNLPPQDFKIRKVQPVKMQQNFIDIPKPSFIDVKFKGQAGYTLYRQYGQVELRAKQIVNNYNGPTGPLKLELWAVPVQAFKSEDWYKQAYGYVIARYQIDQGLTEGENYNDIKINVKYIKRGEYGKLHAFIIKLFSYSFSIEWIQSDAIVCVGQQVLYKEKLEILGKFNYYLLGYPNMRLTIEKIKNNHSYQTGKINIFIVACKYNPNFEKQDYKNAPYDTFASCKLGQLQAGQSFYDIDQVIQYHPPWSGKYVLVLKVFQSKKSSSDRVSFSESQYVCENILTF
ncbi:protein kinase domain containing protein [Stylonychia lemnae]|uniref:Protein kinase domain containing protein n=1 Tax=Stylonychia lemnae TaxID=5949 RepID=A0A077ZZE3_STYLE|nr:protein kinase domain containing protein [Stylonychia lemnae]|eukprot:CDW74593.1 protein kinase domain containing protein [Stylonychia lemnae]